MPAILHVDLDAFYASCEQLRHPELRGRAVIVGGARRLAPGERAGLGRAVVCAASYPARSFGVHSAMPLAEARRLCPDSWLLPVDIAHYATVSRLVFSVLGEVTPLVEPVSLDEAYLDVTGSTRRLGPPEAIAAGLRGAVRERCRLDVSVGVATSKVVAKIASRRSKPDGLLVVPPGTEARFLAPLAITELPGIGPRTAERLHRLRVATLGDLAARDPAALVASLGPAAAQLAARAAGIDPAPVVVPGVPKSISREETYAVDRCDGDGLRRQCLVLGSQVARRLRSRRLTARAVTLRLRTADFETVARRRTLPCPVDADRAVGEAAAALFQATWRDGRPVRLLGVGVEQLQAAAQLDLFGAGGPAASELDRALDRLRDRFGAGAIRRGVDPDDPALDWNRDHLEGAAPGTAR
ncbi:MAG TPA: DNA polymerase IV [Verrucomicrobiae bacterium]|nr:DNA polymerase IV [Verrucomicrobiae bacterium]